jgi:hypothetical protein
MCVQRRPGLGAEAGEEATERCRCKSHAAGGGRAIGTGQMREHGAAPARHARPGIVVDLDHEIVEVVLAPQPVASFTWRASEGPIVTPVAGIFAPGNCRIDPAGRQKRGRAQPAIRPPPQPSQAKAAAGRCAVALALVGADAGPAEDDRNREPPG